MLRLFKTLVLVGLLAACAAPARSFTLLGLKPPWQTHRLGYDVFPLGIGVLLDPGWPFGPMNLGEEYRYNVPVITYGFTSDFLNYFGERGAQEVEKAIRILNDLPPVSRLNLDDYPTGSARVNHRAQVLGLWDLKSFVLQSLLYQMGIGDPTRYVFTLRSRWIPTGTCPPIDYFVIRRHFDPVTLQHSTYINGDLWTYNFIIDTCTPPPDYSLLIPEPVDPMALLGYRHSPVTSQFVPTTYGIYFTTLSRDDVGGLKYIYSPENFNVDNVPLGASGGTNAFFGGGSISGGEINPWVPPQWYVTNVLNATNITGGVGGGPTVGNTNNFVEPALRGGVDKIIWVRADFDSVLGGFFTTFTNTYRETVYVNRRPVQQVVERVIGIPDVLFDCRDLQGGDGDSALVIAAHEYVTWDNNDDINGLPATRNYGPGTVSPSNPTTAPPTPGYVLALNSVGPLNVNIWPPYLSEADSISLGLSPNFFLLWGSFDGTTNAPVIYPFGTSIEAVERRVLGRP